MNNKGGGQWDITVFREDTSYSTVQSNSYLNNCVFNRMLTIIKDVNIEKNN
jgi:hypothetical protein